MSTILATRQAERAARLAAERRAEELAFIKNPENWPRWPVLPVVARKPAGLLEQRCGLVHASDLTKVYFVNMFALASREPKPATWAEAFAGVETKSFPDVEGLLDEYRVD